MGILDGSIIATVMTCQLSRKTSSAASKERPLACSK